MSMLHNLSLPRKFLILGLIALLMTAAPTLLFTKKAFEEIRVASLEVEGARPMIGLQKVIQLAQQHRGIAAGMLGGNQALAASRPAVRDAMTQAIASFEGHLKAAGASPALLAAWAERKAQWLPLEQAVADRKLAPPASFQRHTELIAALFQLNDDLLAEYGVLFDPDADSYYLAMASLKTAPQLAEHLGRMRGLGTGILAAGQISPENRTTLVGLRERVVEASGDLKRGLIGAGRANASLKRVMEPKFTALETQVAATLTLVETQLISAQTLTMPANTYNQALTKTIEDIFELNATALPEFTRLLQQRVTRQQITIATVIGTLAAGALAGIALGLWFVRSITGPIGQSVAIARAVAEGDLGVAVPAHGSNELGQLIEALALMKGQLADVVGSVRRNADQVAIASAQISSGNNDLSARTEQQAAALEQTAASMEELNETVRHTAENARQANQLAVDASSVAIQGGEVVAQVVDTMRGIDDSSKRIADIIGVIDGIAFQTNILALNAAVEAARAGEQGRGFAVVATEVRSLAQRSADAAREIKTLISDSVSRVGRGTALVDQAGATMTGVVDSIQRVTTLVAEISTASSEQSSGVSQVGEAVRQMDSATQQNAALVEQSAAAAESLKQQASQLVQAVSAFKLGGAGSA